MIHQKHQTKNKRTSLTENKSILNLSSIFEKKICKSEIGIAKNTHKD